MKSLAISAKSNQCWNLISTILGRGTEADESSSRGEGIQGFIINFRIWKVLYIGLRNIWKIDLLRKKNSWTHFAV